MKFKSIPKLKKGDKVAILSPSFAAPGKWPHVHKLGLKRIKELFELEPVEFPTTSKIGATKEERSKDLIDAFENPEIKGIITTLGGNDQITYVKNLPTEPFAKNPKPFLGYSDNTHFINHLWLSGVPAYYGGALFTQFAQQGEMDKFTVKYLRHALFDTGDIELEASKKYSDIGLDWNDPKNLSKHRVYEENDGWHWDGVNSAEGITWGGCLESIDELLRHGGQIPTLKDFEQIVLFTETSEEIPSSDYVFRVLRALGERGILKRIQALLVGRPKAWEFGKERNTKEKKAYRAEQRETIVSVVREYNSRIPIIQNMDFGHTEPQIPLPMGKQIKIGAEAKSIRIAF